MNDRLSIMPPISRRLTLPRVSLRWAPQSATGQALYTAARRLSKSVADIAAGREGPR